MQIFEASFYRLLNNNKGVEQKMKKVFAFFVLFIFIISFTFPLLPAKIFAQNSTQIKKQIGIKVDPIGPNIAIDKNIFSDSEAPTNPATFANDGDETTFWSAQDAGIHWLKIDLGDVFANIFATEIVFNGNGIYQYKIEYSLDDNEWTVLVDKSSNTDISQTQYDKFVPPTSGIRYIRVTITSTPNNQPASIKEFKIYKMVDDTFIKGADVSMLKQIEDCGGKFYLNGVQMDALEILKYFGINWIRLRIWNDPKDANGNPLGGGNCSADNMLVIAKRAKALGMKLLLDFHYSDFWADPGKQDKPKAWANLSFDQLKQAVYQYTYDVIKMYKDQGALPDMVQVGNEVNGGMLWPDGKTWGEDAGGYDNFADLLKAGIRGVKDAAGPDNQVKIMIHLANGGDNELYRRVFDNLTQRGVEFDVIGLSYYPYWHGKLSDLIYNMNDISKRYNKEILIAETAYAYTLENGDGLNNIFGTREAATAGYEPSVQNQALVIRNIANAVAQVPDGKGLGVFYWEPDWIPVEGAGWKTGEGNGWDNQAMFDFNGNALDSLYVFKMLNNVMIVGYKPVVVGTAPGEIPKLPAKITAILSNGLTKEVDVTWDSIDPSKYAQAGSFEVYGHVAGSEVTPVAKVKVANLVQNSGFEEDLTGWNIEGQTGAANANSSAPVRSGNKKLNIWYGSPYNLVISQTISGLGQGKYTFKAWFVNTGSAQKRDIVIKDYGGQETRIQIPQSASWDVWTPVEISNISVTTGKCTISFEIAADSGFWCAIDDVLFYRQDPDIEKSIVSVERLDIATEVGQKPQLPPTVMVVYDDGTSSEANVTWEAIDESKYSAIGEFTVTGTVEGTTLKAYAKVKVINSKNLVKNYSFEEGLKYWISEGDTNAVKTETGGHSGGTQLTHWSDKPYKVVTYQTIENIPNGIYIFRAFANGGGGQNANYLFIKDYGGEELRINMPTKWVAEWHRMVITNIRVTTGRVTIGLYSDSENAGGTWCNLDDIEFFKVADREFEISNVSLQKDKGLIASVTVKQSEGIQHDGKEVVVFELLKGTTPISIVAAEKDIVEAEDFKVYFNVSDYLSSDYRVKVFVFDKFDTSPTTPNSLAEPIELR